MAVTLASPAFGILPPTVTAFTAVPSTVAPGDLVTLSVEAQDPNCPGTCTSGCGLMIRADLTSWSATGGAFETFDNGTTGSPYTASATWRAPAAEGSYLITVSLSDNGTFLCGNRQTAAADISVNVSTAVGSPPQILELTASPVRVFPTQISTLRCLASDPDGDALSYGWASDLGSVTPTGTDTAELSSADPGIATVTCTVTDSKGLTALDSVQIAIVGAQAERTITPGLLAPHRLAVDSLGSIFVADQAAGGISVYHLASGEPVYRIPIPGVVAVAVDWADRLVVAQERNVAVTDARGNLLFPLLPGQALGAISDVAVDLAAQRYAVLYRRSGRVVVFDQAGSVIGELGSLGDGPEQLKSPAGLAITPGGLFAVADSGHGMVKVYNLSGQMLLAFGGLGGAVGEMVQLDDVAVDGNGVFYASDAFQDWVQAFNPDGSLREVLGTYGDGVGELKTPTGLAAADAFGRLLVASANSPSLEVYLLAAAPQEPPTPRGVVSRTSLAFGNQALGTVSPPRTVLLSNVGSAPLGLQGLDVGGDFLASHGCGEILAPGASCSLEVRFSPVALGLRSGTLIVRTSAGPPHPQVALTGTGFIAPGLALAPLALNFRDQPLGTTSPPQAVTLTNTGSLALSLSSIGVEGPFEASHTCPTSLVPGGTCQVHVTFTPGAVEDLLSGALVITSNSPQSPHRVVLEGRGVGLLLSANPGRVDFGDIAGGGLVRRTVTVLNTGSDFVSLGPAALSGDGAFYVESDLCSGMRLFSREGCSLTVAFAPTQTGAYSAFLELPSTALTSPNRVELLGENLALGPLEIPTLSEWGLILLGLALALLGLRGLGQRGAVVSGLLLLALGLGPAADVRAQDPPHWASTSIDIGCTTQCHTLHQAPGGALNSSASNVNLCQSCHNPAGLASDLAINTVDAAVPGVRGSSHAFDVPVVNATLGTQAPLDAEMQLRLPGGNVVCSTCHNQHKSVSTRGGDSRVGVARQTTALGSMGTLTSGGTYSGPEGVWILVQVVVAGTETTARFCYSKDSAISWFPAGCNPPGTTSPNLTADTNPVTLDSGVTVSFSPGSFVVGERWELSAAWPFLRASLDNVAGGSAICRDCHRAWEMDHIAVETWDGTFRSHPVGVALDANGQGFDHPVPLDGNGAQQVAGDVDGNPSNDLRFDSQGHVQCLTCHGIHFVDSNTQTADDR